MRNRWRSLVMGMALVVALCAGTGCGSKADEAKPAEGAQPAAEEVQPAEEAPADEEAAVAKDTRTEYAGFDDVREEHFGRFALKVPSYYAKGDSNDHSARFNGQDRDVVITLAAGEGLNGLGGEELLSELAGSLKEAEGASSLETVSEPRRVEGTVLETHLQSFKATISGDEYEEEAAVIIDREGDSVLFLLLLQATSSPYRYTEDFEKVVASVVVKEPAAEAETAAGDGETAGTDIRPEFKEAMDSYEAFFDEYVDFMKLYQGDPTNLDLLLGLSDMLTREAEMMEEFDDWQDEDLNSAELAYYLEVQARIYRKLGEVL